MPAKQLNPKRPRELPPVPDFETVWVNERDVESFQDEDTRLGITEPMKRLLRESVMRVSAERDTRIRRDFNAGKAVLSIMEADALDCLRLIARKYNDTMLERLTLRPMTLLIILITTFESLGAYHPGVSSVRTDWFTDAVKGLHSIFKVVEMKPLRVWLHELVNFLVLNKWNEYVWTDGCLMDNRTGHFTKMKESKKRRWEAKKALRETLKEKRKHRISELQRIIDLKTAELLTAHDRARDLELQLEERTRDLRELQLRSRQLKATTHVGFPT